MTDLILQPILQWSISKCHSRKTNAGVIKRIDGDPQWAGFAENQKEMPVFGRTVRKCGQVTEGCRKEP